METGSSSRIDLMRTRAPGALPREPPTRTRLSPVLSRRNTTHETTESGISARQRSKRKSFDPQAPSPGADFIDLTGDEPGPVTKKQKTQTRKQVNDSPTPEKRARKYRRDPPQSYLVRLERISQQRMFVVGHQVGGSEQVPEISFDIVGSTGNLYKTIIGKVPSCDCPDGLKGNQCKHICYVLLNALKAPCHLQYQLAFLSSELRDIYQGSPLYRVETTSTENTDGKRKPIEGDCPICFMEFEPDESTVWCKAACGNNVHKACFEQWAATTRSTGVRCVYCRTTWKSDAADLTLDSLRNNGDVGEDGYVNVAEQFGLSEERDYSMYSRFSTSRRSYSYGRWGYDWYGGGYW